MMTMIGPKARTFADSRETSNEVAQAILDAADNDHGLAQRLWESPTSDELGRILTAAWRYCAPDETVLFWGQLTFEREFA